MKFKTRTAIITVLWLAVTALFIFLRLNHMNQVLNSPPGRILTIDSLFYYDWALKIFNGLGMGPTVFFMSPLYPLFISFVMNLAGEGVGSVLLYQLILSLITLGLIGNFTTRRFGAISGLIAGLFYSIYAPAIYYDSVLITSNLILCLTMVALTFLDVAERKGGRLWVFLAGIALGLSTLARPNALILLPFLAIVLMKRWKKYGIEQFVILAFATFLVVLPAALHNYLRGGELYITTNSAGINFFIGNNQNANGLYFEAPWLSSAEPNMESGDYRKEAQARLNRSLTTGQASRYWFGQGFNWIISHPVEWILLEFDKLKYFFNRVEIPNNVSFYGVREYSSILRVLGFFNFGWIAPLGLVGLFISRREEGWNLAFLIVIAYLLASLMFFVSGEYRYPVTGILIAYSAGAITRTIYKLTHKEIETAQLAMMGLLILLMACNVPWKLMKTIATPRMDYFNWASVSFMKGDLANASLLFTATIAWDPNWMEPHIQLAQVYDQMNMTQMADAEYKYAGITREDLIEARNREELSALVDPDSLEMEGAMSALQLAEVGARFNKLYKYELAVQILERSVSLDTSNYDARFQYGFALEATGRLKKALEVYYSLERVQDHDPLIPFRIAHVLVSQGDRGSAQSTLRRVKMKAEKIEDTESRNRWLTLIKRTSDSFMNF